ncbi:hypothetical protein BDZ89DRAFT_1056203 [Hymenopellis radicata]|nr:hypothetical protein BDZ89DRAFT_1056203 [Hymenopellis radicata]
MALSSALSFSFSCASFCTFDARLFTLSMLYSSCQRRAAATTTVTYFGLASPVKWDRSKSRVGDGKISGSDAGMLMISLRCSSSGIATGDDGSSGSSLCS